MTDEEKNLEDFIEDFEIEGGESGGGDEDYRNDPRWRMDNLERLATKSREDAGVIVQHPIREEADEGSDVEYIETMGLSVSAPTPTGAFTIQNTSSDSNLVERFVALDVEMIDLLISALEEVKSRHEDDGTFACPCCENEYDFPEELDQDEHGFNCPDCGYLL